VAARRVDPILRPRQARYLERLRPPDDPHRAAIAREAAAAGIATTHPDTARLLEALAAIAPGGRVLELGTGAGFATLHLARGAASGRVVSIEVDAERLERARANLERAGVAARVELRHGAALELLAELEGPFDLAVVDADPRDARRCLDLVVPLLPVGGRVVVDRLLAGGAVADPALRGAGSAAAEAAERFNPYFTIHPQLAAVVLPVGDGVGLGVKRRPTIRELGGPF
jgi:caffeoyl-CoA O-methyltransferase